VNQKISKSGLAVFLTFKFYVLFRNTYFLRLDTGLIPNFHYKERNSLAETAPLGASVRSVSVAHPSCSRAITTLIPTATVLALGDSLLNKRQPSENVRGKA